MNPFRWLFQALGFGGRQAVLYAEDTIDILRYAWRWTYIWVGLVSPLILGPIGYLLAAGTEIPYVGAPFRWISLFIGVNVAGLGHWGPFAAIIICGTLGFIVIGRVMVPVLLVQMLPDWFKSRAAKWAMKDGITQRIFHTSSTIGMWSHALLLVPATFPVWTNWTAYFGMLAGTMFILYLVATAKMDVAWWRNWVMGPYIAFFVGLWALNFVIPGTIERVGMTMFYYNSLDRVESRHTREQTREDRNYLEQLYERDREFKARYREHLLNGGSWTTDDGNSWAMVTQQVAATNPGLVKATVSRLNQPSEPTSQKKKSDDGKLGFFILLAAIAIAAAAGSEDENKND